MAGRARHGGGLGRNAHLRSISPAISIIYRQILLPDGRPGPAGHSVLVPHIRLKHYESIAYIKFSRPALGQFVRPFRAPTILVNHSLSITYGRNPGWSPYCSYPDGGTNELAKKSSADCDAGGDRRAGVRSRAVDTSPVSKSNPSPGGVGRLGILT